MGAGDLNSGPHVCTAGALSHGVISAAQKTVLIVEFTAKLSLVPPLEVRPLLRFLGRVTHQRKRLLWCLID